MADLTITAANVKIMSNSSPYVGLAGEALTQGQPVYVSGSKWYKCDANQTAIKANAGGIVLTPASTDGYFAYAVDGSSIDLGTTLTKGKVYAVSATAGGICPIADLVTTGDYITTLGTATAADTLVLNIVVSGTQLP